MDSVVVGKNLNDNNRSAGCMMMMMMMLVAQFDHQFCDCAAR